MRLWSIHPRYLDTKGLLALWREGLLAQAVLLGKTRGYVNHPQLIRFRKQKSPTGAIAAYLEAVHEESVRRGFSFDRSLLGASRHREPIPVTRGQLEYEWKHLLSKLRNRRPEQFRKICNTSDPAPHPLFRVIPGQVEHWERQLHDYDNEPHSPRRYAPMKGNLLKTAPVPHQQVQIHDGFWGERLQVNRDVTIPIGYRHCKKTGRIDAFKLDWKKGKPNQPHVFWDSDVAKWVEAASHSIAADPNPALKRKLEQVVDLIASAQQPDGYLNVHFTVVEPKKRWSNLRDLHELYCAGHLMEAAVAHHEATGSRKLLDVMCRYADYIGKVFGRGRGKKRGYPGHEEIELALVKLYRATGRKKYLSLAKYFVDERGQSPHYYDQESKKRGERPRANYDDIQAHLPVRRQKTADGHAVRAGYLYAGMADVAAETGDKELLAACRTLWKNITTKRMYVHGSIGSSRFGERFTIDYDLPNETAYAETCAAISLVFFAHRMLQIDPDSQYSDVIERALYNGIISGVSQTGDHFFYDNPLSTVPAVHDFRRQKSPVRQEWFGCACCPTNIVRILASLGQYVYSQSKNSVYVHLYVNGDASVSMKGTDVTLTQRTRYPWEGKVRLKVSPDSPSAFTVALRIPGWCRRAKATVNGKPVAAKNSLRKGYLLVNRLWKKGDAIELRMEMPVERVEAHPSVRHDCGKVALQRGPVLYCLEEKDNGKDLHDLMLPRKSKLSVKRPSSGTFKGIPVITGRALSRDPAEWRADLYRTDGTSYKPCRLTAIPYFMWANRGEGEMITWIREASEGK